MNLARRILIAAPVLLSCVGCDQVTKNIARQHLANSQPLVFLSGIFRLQYAENPGAFLSLGAGSPEGIKFWIFIILVAIFLSGMLGYIMVSRIDSKTRLICFSLIVGGGVGNLIDRIFNAGRVVDFMNLGIGSLRTGIFNVADVAISFGVIYLCLLAYQAPTKPPFSSCCTSR